MATIQHLAKNSAVQKTQKPTSQGYITLDHQVSRHQALSALGGRKPVANQQVYSALYELYHKLGANSELPAVIDSRDMKGIKRRNSYLNDLWVTMYLKNPIVPGHIPFDVIIEEFTTFAVQNSSDRYGNNQAAIIQQFNNWIKKAEVQHKLTALRDQRYPEKAPAKLKESNPTVKIEDLTTQALKQRIESMLPFEGLKTVDAMIAEYRAELDRRGSYE